MTSTHAPFLQDAAALFQRLTSPRRTLLTRILEKAHHFSAEEVCRETPAVGRATVYRTLRQLAKAGLLCRVSLKRGAIRYQLAPRRHHHHLVCLRCDRVVDVESCQVSGFAEEVSRSHGFAAMAHRLEVYGVCPTCQEASAPNLALALERRQ